MKTRAGRPKTLVRRHQSLVCCQRPHDGEGSVVGRVRLTGPANYRFSTSVRTWAFRPRTLCGLSPVVSSRG